MTFEELLVLIDKMNGEAGNATGGNVDSLVYSGLDVHLMLEEIKSGIERLQETYAPKIKMTFEQKSKLMIFIYERELYKEFSKKELMQAWLHPELIEVSDD